jgi:hypothetical protein
VHHLPGASCVLVRVVVGLHRAFEITCAGDGFVGAICPPSASGCSGSEKKTALKVTDSSADLRGFQYQRYTFESAHGSRGLRYAVTEAAHAVQTDTPQALESCRRAEVRPVLRYRIRKELPMGISWKKQFEASGRLFRDRMQMTARNADSVLQMPRSCARRCRETVVTLAVASLLFGAGQAAAQTYSVTTLPFNHVPLRRNHDARPASVSGRRR